MLFRSVGERVQHVEARRAAGGQHRCADAGDARDSETAQQQLEARLDKIEQETGRRPKGKAAKEITVGAQTYPAETHVGILIYPNPLNPKKYVVLNSGFTFREYDYLNNARQVPKLPDWAVIDLRTPPGSRYPGKVMAADFFSEEWRVKPESERR